MMKSGMAILMLALLQGHDTRSYGVVRVYALLGSVFGTGETKKVAWDEFLLVFRCGKWMLL